MSNDNKDFLATIVYVTLMMLVFMGASLTCVYILMELDHKHKMQQLYLNNNLKDVVCPPSTL